MLILVKFFLKYEEGIKLNPVPPEKTTLKSLAYRINLTDFEKWNLDRKSYILRFSGNNFPSFFELKRLFHKKLILIKINLFKFAKISVCIHQLK